MASPRSTTWAVVYNLRVADHHTYFVGKEEWGFSVWAHNAYGHIVQDRAGNDHLAPFGFSNYEGWLNFSRLFYSKMKAIDPRALGLMQGSAVTGISFDPPHLPFDQGRTSDFDVAIISPGLILRAQEKGIDVTDVGFGLGKRTQPIDDQALAAKLGLSDLRTLLSEAYRRPVNFIVYETREGAVKNKSSMPFLN